MAGREASAGRPAPSLKSRALRYLSAREHARPELERKLAPHAASPEELARVLDELQAKGYISEARVVESVLHRRAGQFGALRLRQELQQKGVMPEAVAQALDGLKNSELERATTLWQRRFAPPADAAERARQTRFLLARGFSAAVVAKVFKQAAQET